MCAGVVPQHPPIRFAPAAANRSANAAISAGLFRKTVLPSTSSGSPALGSTERHAGATPAIASRSGSISSGPRLQFTPTAAAPEAASTMAATSGGVPEKVLPSSPKVAWATTGMSETSRAATSAAFASRISEKVSRKRASAPARASARICSRNVSTASSNVSAPNGASCAPSGPTEPAT